MTPSIHILYINHTRIAHIIDQCTAIQKTITDDKENLADLNTILNAADKIKYNIAQELINATTPRT